MPRAILVQRSVPVYNYLSYLSRTTSCDAFKSLHWILTVFAETLWISRFCGENSQELVSKHPGDRTSFVQCLENLFQRTRIKGHVFVLFVDVVYTRHSSLCLYFVRREQIRCARRRFVVDKWKNSIGFHEQMELIIKSMWFLSVIVPQEMRWFFIRIDLCYNNVEYLHFCNTKQYIEKSGKLFLIFYTSEITIFIILPVGRPIMIIDSWYFPNLKIDIFRLEKSINAEKWTKYNTRYTFYLTNNKYFHAKIRSSFSIKFNNHFNLQYNK